MSVNKAILIGHVGKDPEVRYLDKNVAVATFTVATTEKGYTAQNGTQVPDRTEWHNIVAWRGLAEVAEKYIRKGSQLYVEGKIQTRSWEKEGIKRYTTEILADTIQLLGKKPEAADATNYGSTAPSTAASSSELSQTSKESIEDDGNSLPF